MDMSTYADLTFVGDVMGFGLRKRTAVCPSEVTSARKEMKK
jgi:hypothetical protein